MDLGFLSAVINVVGRHEGHGSRARAVNRIIDPYMGAARIGVAPPVTNPCRGPSVKNPCRGPLYRVRTAVFNRLVAGRFVARPLILLRALSQKGRPGLLQAL